MNPDQPLARILITTLLVSSGCVVWAQTSSPRTVVLHAARLLDVESGRVLTPGEGRDSSCSYAGLLSGLHVAIRMRETLIQHPATGRGEAL
jgi:hypothetical protein